MRVSSPEACRARPYLHPLAAAVSTLAGPSAGFIFTSSRLLITIFNLPSGTKHHYRQLRIIVIAQRHTNTWPPRLPT